MNRHARMLPAVVALFLAFASTARANESDSGLAFISGAGSNLAGFLLGGTLLATSHGHNAQSNAGWLAIEGGFVVAPFVAHAMVGEWGRGALFAAAPGGAWAANSALLAAEPSAVERGSLPQQRWMWAFFGVGLFSSAAGVVDAMFALDRARHVVIQPTVGAGQLGLCIAGVL